jgi:parallel beta-helix repeat protein
MKTRIPMVIALALLALSTLSPQLSICFAQGSLTPPPGAPAPTMLTLSQIEPRTPVDATHTGSGGSSEFLITQPGSYYLTTNVVGVSSLHGINISANNVTLDLNGFSLQGSSSALDAIYIHAGYTNVTVRDGNISDWSNASPFYGYGIECYANNVILERLNVSANRYGIFLTNSGVVLDCNCHNNAATGIYVVAGKVSGCEALNNAATGIYVVMGTVSDCDALNNTSYGIEVGNNCTVKNCTSDNNYDGVFVNGSYSQITGNTCSSNSDSGIEIPLTKDRIDNNTVGDNGSYGILEYSQNVDNIITRNFAPGNFVNYYQLSGNTDYAPVQIPSTATSPWANF